MPIICRNHTLAVYKAGAAEKKRHADDAVNELASVRKHISAGLAPLEESFRAQVADLKVDVSASAASATRATDDATTLAAGVVRKQTGIVRAEREAQRVVDANVEFQRESQGNLEETVSSAAKTQAAMVHNASAAFELAKKRADKEAKAECTQATKSAQQVQKEHGHLVESLSPVLQELKRCKEAEAKELQARGSNVGIAPAIAGDIAFLEARASSSPKSQDPCAMLTSQYEDAFEAQPAPALIEIIAAADPAIELSKRLKKQTESLSQAEKDCVAKAKEALLAAAEDSFARAKSNARNKEMTAIQLAQDLHSSNQAEAEGTVSRAEGKIEQLQISQAEAKAKAAVANSTATRLRQVHSRREAEAHALAERGKIWLETHINDAERDFQAAKRLIEKEQASADATTQAMSEAASKGVESNCLEEVKVRLDESSAVVGCTTKEFPRGY